MLSLWGDTVVSLDSPPVITDNPEAKTNSKRPVVSLSPIITESTSHQQDPSCQFSSLVKLFLCSFSLGSLSWDHALVFIGKRETGIPSF